MPITNTSANEVIDALLGDATIWPATVYIGLMTAAPALDGSGVVEPSGGSYARVAVTNNLTQWPAAASRTKSNANEIAFPTATAGWGTISHVGIFSASSGGDLLGYQALATARGVLNGDTFKLPAGDLQVTVA